MLFSISDAELSSAIALLTSDSLLAKIDESVIKKYVLTETEFSKT